MLRPIRTFQLAVLGLTLLTTAAVSAATPEDLDARLNALAAQVTALQSEVAALKAEKAAASAPAAGMAPARVAAAPAAAPDAGPVEWFGYGELNYSRPTGDAAGATADVGRFVLGASYAFDDKTRFVSELELEHAVSSADDPGEVEVEQAYIERRLSDSVFAKAGLFLIPVGLLNENHEPTRYYGVFRNFVETAIIPTTWREGGFAVQGNTRGGLRWDAGISTGFNLSKWDATASEGQRRAAGFHPPGTGAGLGR